MELVTDIIGKTLYFHEMEPVTIQASSSEKDTPVAIVLKKDGSEGAELLNEQYYPDFDGTIKIDIRDILADQLWLELPQPGAELSQVNICKDFFIRIGETISGTFSVNGMSTLSKSRMSDIDILRIPADCLLAVSVHNFVERSGLSYVSPGKTQSVEDVLSTDGSGRGSVIRLIPLDSTPMASEKTFHIEMSCGATTIKSPQYRICHGRFEQYFFMNRYGGFDNVPMDGSLTFEPETEHGSGIYRENVEQISSDVEYIYTQDSGYVSRQVINAMSELICSGQIYHYAGGVFRRIIIEESSLSSSSAESLHSFSFKYRYADKAGYSAITGIGGQSISGGITVGITESPQIINHKMGRRPSVTVIDSDGYEVECEVKFLDEDRVSVSWTGELNGLIYLN